MAQERKHSVANQIRCSFLAPDHGDNQVGDDFFFVEPGAIHLSGHHGLDQAFARVHFLFPHCRTEIGAKALNAAQDAWKPLRIVLEVAQHLGEVLRPLLQLSMVGSRNAQQFRCYDCRGWTGEVGDHIHVSPGND